MDAISAGRLLLVTAPAASREAVERGLAARVGPQDVRWLHDGAFVIYADAAPATVADWLALACEAPALVIEFERWSATASAIDPAWLLRRGH